MAADRLIHWVCTSPDHRRSLELGLTRHRGQWALCHDLLSADHDWLDTGGVDVSAAVACWQEAASGRPESTPSPAA